MHRNLGDNADIDVVNVLIEHGADLNSKNASGETPLHRLFGNFYSSSGSELVEILIKAGANKEEVDESGTKPLERLLSNEAIRLLTS